MSGYISLCLLRKDHCLSTIIYIYSLVRYLNNLYNLDYFTSLQSTFLNILLPSLYYFLFCLFYLTEINYYYSERKRRAHRERWGKAHERLKAKKKVLEGLNIPPPSPNPSVTSEIPVSLFNKHTYFAI